MSRGKGSHSRKEAAAEQTMVGRRSFMELICPIAPLHRKRPVQSESVLPPIPPLDKDPVHLRQATEGPVQKRQRTGYFSSVSTSPPLPSAHSEQSSDLPHMKESQAYPHPSLPGQPEIPNFLYAPFRTFDLDKVFKSPGETKGLARVHIPVEHLTASNPAIRMRNLWGSGRYTDDSDLVAVLLHTGLYNATVHAPKTFQYLSVLVELEKHVNGKSDSYPCALVKGFASRSWGSKYEGASMAVRSVALLSLETAIIPPQRSRRKTRIRPHRLIPWNKTVPRKSPPASGTANNAVATYSRDGKLEAKRAVQCGTMSFDMLQEPCLVYDIKEVACLRAPTSITDRLRKEILYIEDDSRRFEISVTEQSSSKSSARDAGSNEDVFVRFAEVPDGTLQKLRLWNAGLQVNEKGGSLDVTVPLATKDLNVIAKKMPWKELVWDSEGVTIQGVWYDLTRLTFKKKTTDR